MHSVPDTIGLRLPADDTGVRRLAVSPGTRAVRDEDGAGLSDACPYAPAYAPEARLPLDAWQELGDAATAELLRVPAGGTVIRLLRLPEQVTAGFRDAGSAAERVGLDYARSLLPPGADCVSLGCDVRAAGQCTTTVDPAVGRRIGLHVDSWDGWNFHAPASARPRRTRLNLNLAGTPRYLLFMRLNIGDIWAAADAHDRKLGPTPLLQAFLRSRPAAPVYRLEIRPGEAYIAPTDIMPHDSSTLGARQADVSLSLIGHFDAIIP